MCPHKNFYMRELRTHHLPNDFWGDCEVLGWGDAGIGGGGGGGATSGLSKTCGCLGMTLPRFGFEWLACTATGEGAFTPATMLPEDCARPPRVIFLLLPAGEPEFPECNECCEWSEPSRSTPGSKPNAGPGEAERALLFPGGSGGRGSAGPSFIWFDSI